jgi:peroxiredoxin
MSRLSSRRRGQHAVPSPQTRARDICSGRSCEHLIGRLLPLKTLPTWPEPLGGFGPLARTGSLILCIYPGMTEETGEVELDTARALSWQAYGRRSLALGYMVAFLSARPLGSQSKWMERERLSCTLVSDPELTLHGELALPTIDIGGTRVYDHLTLVASEGEVTKVFYPLVDPERDAKVVMAWLREVHG